MPFRVKRPARLWQGSTSGTLQPRSARAMKPIELTACSPCIPPAVETSATGLFD
jgi:hypothetical protein